jgi:hypothetical protein
MKTASFHQVMLIITLVLIGCKSDAIKVMNFIPAGVYFLLLFLIPGSPRYLVKIGKIESARNILTRIKIGSIETRMVEIRENHENARNNNVKMISCQYMNPISIAFLMAMFNQFSGINAILYYAPKLYELSRVNTEDFLSQSVRIGMTKTVFTTVGMLTIDRFGRKMLLMVGSTGMSICLGLISRAFFNGDFAGNILLVFLLVYFMFISTMAVWFFPFVVGTFATRTGISFAVFSAITAMQVIAVRRYFPKIKAIPLNSSI